MIEHEDEEESGIDLSKRIHSSKQKLDFTDEATLFKQQTGSDGIVMEIDESYTIEML